MTVGRIRRAELSDLPALVALGERLYAEAPHYQGVTFDGAALDGQLRALWAAGGVALVAEGKAGKPVGVILGSWYVPLGSRARHAAELSLFVEPGSRGSWVAMRLVEALEEWARAEGAAEELHVGTSTGVFTERVAEWYERQGYVRSGVSLRKRL